jgi:hypothetical protein
MALAVVAQEVHLIIDYVQHQEAVIRVNCQMEALELLTLVAVEVEQEVQPVAVHSLAVLAVQVTHELLIGVNYGTTLCIFKK